MLPWRRSRNGRRGCAPRRAARRSSLFTTRAGTARPATTLGPSGCRPPTSEKMTSFSEVKFCMPQRSKPGPAPFPLVVMICEWCGSGSNMKRSEARRQRFCSKICYAKARVGKTPGMTAEKVCVICDVRFKPTGSNQKYCSPKCWPVRSNKAEPKRRVCHCCFNDFYNSRPKMYCSDACLKEAKSETRSPGWVNGKYIDGDGYVYIRPEGKLIREHRYVMGQALGRKLLSTETVHHINGNRSDNQLDNLQLRTGQHGSGQVRRCFDCGSSNVGAVPIS
jgi:hypothetical protein